MLQTPNATIQPIAAASPTAVRDALASQIAVIHPDERARHRQFCQGIVECLKPVNALEAQLAQSIAADYWRLNRVRALEDGIYSLCDASPESETTSVPSGEQIAASLTQTFLNRQDAFKFLSQYEMRVQRALNRNKVELRQLQAERARLEVGVEAGPEAQPEPHPAPSPENGFAFSALPADATETPNAAARHVAAKAATAQPYGPIPIRLAS